MEESGNDPVKVLPWNFLGWTEEHHNTHDSHSARCNSKQAPS